MLDRDLPELYRSETKFINRAVNRYPQRFPDSFVFDLTKNEWESLRFQIGTLKSKGTRGELRKYLLRVFTEQRVAMVSAVLNTETTSSISIQVMQAFASMRKLLLQNASVSQPLDQLELNLVQTEEKIERILKALEASQHEPEKGIFFGASAHHEVSPEESKVSNIILPDLVVDFQGYRINTPEVWESNWKSNYGD